MQPEPTPAQEESKATKASHSAFVDRSAQRLASFTVAAFLFFLFLYGCCVQGLVWREPDICFLLGGGRWIVEHGQVPFTDPFSYTTHYHWAQYVVEKWLTEVIFYLILSKLGAVALVAFDAMMLSLAFVVIPYRIFYRCGWRGFSAFGLVVLCALTSCSHLAVRPEIFSFVLTGIWLEMLIAISEKTKESARIDWLAIAVLSVLMCFWCNLHTLFLVGIFLPVCYCGCMILESFLPGLKKQPINWTVAISILACLLASLVNPWGYGLWTYIPNVFGPFNDTNNEMQSIKMSSVGNPLFFPYYLFIIVGIKSLLRQRFPARRNELFFRSLILLGAICGLKTIRSIPLADLFLVAGTAATVRRAKPGDNRIIEQAGAYLDKLAQPQGLSWTLQCLLAPALGAYLMTFSIPIEIPQGSKAFTPPNRAIEFIAKNPPAGNLLNDPHFGACLIWKMRNNPPVFIDPRYNLFGNALLQDYWKMVTCKPGWQERLQYYNIGWTFLPPELELCKRLAKDPQWRLLYSDQASVIYSRRVASESKQEK